jgi:hypothetical protein
VIAVATCAAVAAAGLVAAAPAAYAASPNVVIAEVYGGGGNSGAPLDSDFVELLPLAQSTVSQHLKVLKEAGVIQGTIEGGDQCYCLEPDTVRWLSNFTYDICCPDGEACEPGQDSPC